MTELSTAEFLNACAVLFGPEVEVSSEFLRYLRPSGIKAAYWKLALETHPDRAKALGKNEAKMNERFKEISLAYERLRSVVKEGGNFSFTDSRHVSNAPSEASPPPSPCRHFSDHYYTGYVPGGRLLLGRFMYYSGLISWQMLIKAISWQRRQRPPIGQVALQWGMLSAPDIQRILTARHFGEKFGECAVRDGWLTPFKLLALLGRQRSLHRPIGEYFLKNGIFRPRDMEKIVERQRIHNKTVYPWRFFSH